MEKITNMLFPVIVSAIAWLLTSMSSIQADLINIKSKMPILITEQGYRLTAQYQQNKELD